MEKQLNQKELQDLAKNQIKRVESESIINSKKLQPTVPLNNNYITNNKPTTQKPLFTNLDKQKNGKKLKNKSNSSSGMSGNISEHELDEMHYEKRQFETQVSGPKKAS